MRIPFHFDGVVDLLEGILLGGYLFEEVGLTLLGAAGVAAAAGLRGRRGGRVHCDLSV